MAPKSTIYKAELQVADMDRNYYGSHSLTLALHPSETLERMMVRLLAFGLHAADELCFGRGLSTDDEPDLWKKDLTGAIELWIDVGLPDEKLVRKACSRAASVYLYAYGRTTDIWWKQQKSDRLENLNVYAIPHASSQTLAKLAARSMKLDLTVQEGQIWLGNGAESVQIELVSLRTTG